MEASDQNESEKKKITKVQTFPVSFALEEIKKNISITANSLSRSSHEEIINQAINFQLQGNISEAIKNYLSLINQGCMDHRIFSNYGIIQKKLGNLKEAELLTRKAIQLNPNLADAHSNLGNILWTLRQLKEAEVSTRKAIELNPDFANAHLNLGNILKDLGKLQEAELSHRKAVELNPNFAMAHTELGNTLRSLGKLKEAELSQLKAIKLNPEFAIAHSNLGSILRDLGKLKEAELSQRKAIELNPNFAIAHSNLGGILRDLGKLQEAELAYQKSIKLNPNFTKAYYSLSLLHYSTQNKKWQHYLFSKEILNQKSQKEKIDIYFARANIFHKEKNYIESTKCIQLANKLELEINPSNYNTFIQKSNTLFIESIKQKRNKINQQKSYETIFIVGMFRSGSTLLESILSMNNDVKDLGEINILEESFQEWKKSNKDVDLTELYWNKANIKSKSKITTNKYLYNYQYAGIICNQIPNAKIIHCYRNPLDNILSIYRAHFGKGNQYTASLVDCAKVYLNQEQIMREYKTRFRSKIYDLNYDFLVSNPNQEIRSLINWLGWKWNDCYLSPHLNPRSVSTASSVQVRYPINSKSIGGWKNYKDMLEPAIEILNNSKMVRRKD